MCPALDRPDWLVSFLILVTIAAGASTAITLGLAAPGTSMVLNFFKKEYWLGGSVVGITFCFLGVRLTNGMNTAFRQSMRTVRDHVRWLVANDPQLLGSPPGQYSRELVAEKVREIVIDILCCNNYREDARFVQDLGLN